jgi:uncharacterized protein
MFWDGATAALNNPVLAAVTEALANGTKPDEIRVLSIGTGTVRPAPETWPEKLFTPRWFKDIKKMMTTILDDPPDSASFIAHVALTNGNRNPLPIVRINPVIESTCPHFKRLEAMEMNDVEQDDVDLIVSVTETWIDGSSSGISNQLIRPSELPKKVAAALSSSSSSSSSPSTHPPVKIIGKYSFAEAKHEWVALCTAKTNVKK